MLLVYFILAVTGLLFYLSQEFVCGGFETNQYLKFFPIAHCILPWPDFLPSLLRKRSHEELEELCISDSIAISSRDESNSIRYFHYCGKRVDWHSYDYLPPRFLQKPFY